MDAFGNEVYFTTITGNETQKVIATERLKSGIYFVKLTNSSNNETIIKKLIKK